MSNETVFALKFIVTVIVAAALSFTLRAGPVSALAQGDSSIDGRADGVLPANPRAIVPPQPTVASTGDPEADFAARMIAYHQEAIEAARADLNEGVSPKLRAIAERSIAGQRASIDELEAWLAER